MDTAQKQGYYVDLNGVICSTSDQTKGFACDVQGDSVIVYSTEDGAVIEEADFHSSTEEIHAIWREAGIKS